MAYLHTDFTKYKIIDRFLESDIIRNYIKVINMNYWKYGTIT